ncbi:MAG: hypothetical protein ACJAVV_001859 [Alphaproteobacteria bacterium]|jgi:hypothetical protein
MPIQSPNSSFLSRISGSLGKSLATFLNTPRSSYKPFSLLSEAQLQLALKPGDLILVEGNSRISSAIKYLTQSTWSHVCIYIGEQQGLQPLLEADLVEGVITVPLNKYDGFNLRICRPHQLTEADTKTLLTFLTDRIGVQYDTKNIVDLMRYLLPTPPVPMRYRRRMLTFGSGDPTKAICSTLVAQAFQSIEYPILPITLDDDVSSDGSSNRAVYSQIDVMLRRHHSHFTPRDFDLSPYFNIVKPTLNAGFNYKNIEWDRHPEIDELT